jgi:hypothetical protein
MIHQVDFPGLGALEATPNGDAEFYTELLGVSTTIHSVSLTKRARMIDVISSGK